MKATHPLSLLLLCATSTLLIAASAVAGPAAASIGKVDAETVELEIDWQATKDLVFIELPGDDVPMSAQVRIARGDEALFFEQITFAQTATERSPSQWAHASTPRAMQLMAFQPAERAWLLDELRSAPADALGTYRLQLSVDGAELIDGPLAQAVKASDQLRQGAFSPLASSSDFADLRPTLPTKLCVDDCYDDYADCREDFCYWDYDEYMCNEGCRLERDECLAIADPVCPTPTCTPGVINTTTDTVLTNSQYLGLDCRQSFFYPYEGTLHALYYLTYQTTTTELRRREDCSTYSVVVGVSYSNTYCYNNINAPCGYTPLWPSCVF